MPIVIQNLAADLKDESIYLVSISTHMNLLPSLQPDPECLNPGWKYCRNKLTTQVLYDVGMQASAERKEGRDLQGKGPSWELPFPPVIHRNPFLHHLARSCSHAMA